MTDTGSEDEHLLGVCEAWGGNMAIFGRYLELLF